MEASVNKKMQVLNIILFRHAVKSQGFVSMGVNAIGNESISHGIDCLTRPKILHSALLTHSLNNSCSEQVDHQESRSSVTPVDNK